MFRKKKSNLCIYLLVLRLLNSTIQKWWIHVIWKDVKKYYFIYIQIWYLYNDWHNIFQGVQHQLEQIYLQYQKKKKIEETGWYFLVYKFLLIKTLISPLEIFQQRRVLCRKCNHHTDTNIDVTIQHLYFFPLSKKKNNCLRSRPNVEVF